MKFNKEYTKYWASTIQKSIDGTLIAGPYEARHFLDSIDLKENSIILDTGCSFGRMNDLLSSYSENIYGVDPDKYAVDEASKKSYIQVLEGTAEQTGFRDSFFDLVFCWATFDVVDHQRGLKEFNRILKKNSTLIITGKNTNYFENDVLAYKAEKNAFLKDFPNKFTDLKIFLSNLKTFGFKLKNLFLFPERGDFGKLNFKTYDYLSPDSNKSYEYLMICEKTSSVEMDLEELDRSDKAFSDTSVKIAQREGFDSPKEMFQKIGLD